jgi:predicted permease
MSVTTRFVLFQIVIIVPFLLGSLTKKRFADPERAARRLIRMNLIGIEPFIALWSIWGLSLTGQMTWLPFSGVLLVLGGMAAGRTALSFMPLRGRTRASFLISSSIANHGFTMGAFICYLFMGERGLGLAFLFLSYFLPYIFTVIFPYARSVSTGGKMSLAFIGEYLFDLQNMPLLAIILGVVLHAVGIPRPGVPFPVDAFIIVSIALYYFCMGMNFEFSGMLSSNMENLWLASIKFLAVPAAAVLCLSLTPLDPELKTVIAIQSFMPAAIYSVAASVLFGLDTRLASNLFAVNTLVFLFLVLPLLFLGRGYILAL